MVTRVNLRVAKVLLQYAPALVAYLMEQKSKSGKYRIVFGIFYLGDNERHVCHYTTDYLTSKTSYRFMISV